MYVKAFSREKTYVMQARILRETYDNEEKVVSEERDIKQTQGSYVRHTQGS